MKAILIVFLPPRSGQAATDPVSLFHPPDRWEDLAEWNGTGYRHPSHRGPALPPFWTWFIENPPGRNA